MNERMQTENSHDWNCFPKKKEKKENEFPDKQSPFSFTYDM